MSSTIPILEAGIFFERLITSGAANMSVCSCDSHWYDDAFPCAQCPWWNQTREAREMRKLRRSIVFERIDDLGKRLAAVEQKKSQLLTSPYHQLSMQIDDVKANIHERRLVLKSTEEQISECENYIAIVNSSLDRMVRGNEAIPQLRAAYERHEREVLSSQREVDQCKKQLDALKLSPEAFPFLKRELDRINEIEARLSTRKRDIRMFRKHKEKSEIFKRATEKYLEHLSSLNSELRDTNTRFENAVNSREAKSDEDQMSLLSEKSKLQKHKEELRRSISIAKRDRNRIIDNFAIQEASEIEHQVASLRDLYRNFEAHRTEMESQFNDRKQEHELMLCHLKKEEPLIKSNVLMALENDRQRYKAKLTQLYGQREEVKARVFVLDVELTELNLSRTALDKEVREFREQSQALDLEEQQLQERLNETWRMYFLPAAKPIGD